MEHTVFTVTASDGVNTSPPSSAVDVTVDTTIAAPAITDPVAGTKVLLYPKYQVHPKLKG